jgi:beta-lactamase regulating signal transducer with metallopeptidase domain
LKLIELVELANALALVDVLANWLWQGCAVALAATAILRLSPRLSATSRYHLWWVALSVVLVLPFLPWLSYGRHVEAGFAGAANVAGPPATSTLPTTSLGVVLPTFPPWAFALLVTVWFGWAMLSLSRTVLALVALGEAKLAARPFPRGREARLETWLSLRGHGRRAELGLSDSVRAAAVLGLTSPTIVVAPSALATLDDQELDQIIVHEWAHVQRRDDLVRVGQRIIVALAGLHPAVWWIDRQLNLERETACDDWAVNATGSARGLAVCLTKLAAMPGRPADAVLLPAAFLSSQLTTRVVRLLDRRRNTSTTLAAGAPMLVAPVLSALALAVASVQLVVTSPGILDERPDTSLEPAVVRDADPASLERVGIDSGTANRRPDRQLRPDVRPRRVLGPSVAPVRGTSAGNSSAVPGSIDRTAIPPTDVRPHTPRPDAIVPLVRPGVEGTLEADLPGLRVGVAANVPPATVDGSGPTGTSAGVPPTPWGAAADAGVTVGKGTQKAAVATAGFFTKLSKSISGVF